MTTVYPAEIADAVWRMESQTFVREVDWFDELGSTNDYALSLVAQSEVVVPRLVWAARQHSGRGRNGNAWWSAAGALTFSLLVETQQWGVGADRWPLVSLSTGLAVADALAEIVGDSAIRLKWPNDVLLNDRKVCGILVEPSRTGRSRLVIGVGVNVQNSFVAAPPELKAVATSLCDHVGPQVLPVSVLLAILNAWEERIRQLAAGPNDLVISWKRRCHLSDHRVRVTAGEQTTEGICRGIDDGGALLVETTNGLVRRLSGTVRRMD